MFEDDECVEEDDPCAAGEAHGPDGSCEECEDDCDKCHFEGEMHVCDQCTYEIYNGECTELGDYDSDLHIKVLGGF